MDHVNEDNLSNPINLGTSTPSSPPPSIHSSDMDSPLPLSDPLSASDSPSQASAAKILATVLSATSSKPEDVLNQLPPKPEDVLNQRELEISYFDQKENDYCLRYLLSHRYATPDGLEKLIAKITHSTEREYLLTSSMSSSFVRWIFPESFEALLKLYEYSFSSNLINCQQWIFQLVSEIGGNYACRFFFTIHRKHFIAISQSQEYLNFLDAFSLLTLSEDDYLLSTPIWANSFCNQYRLLSNLYRSRDSIVCLPKFDATQPDPLNTNFIFSLYNFPEASSPYAQQIRSAGVLARPLLMQKHNTFALSTREYLPILEKNLADGHLPFVLHTALCMLNCSDLPDFRKVCAIFAGAFIRRQMKLATYFPRDQVRLVLTLICSSTLKRIISILECHRSDINASASIQSQLRQRFHLTDVVELSIPPIVKDPSFSDFYHLQIYVPNLSGMIPKDSPELWSFFDFFQHAAITFPPEFQSEILFQCGQICFATSMEAKAREFYHQSMSLNSDDPRPDFMIAMISASADLQDEFDTAFHRALKKDILLRTEWNILQKVPLFERCEPDRPPKFDMILTLDMFNSSFSHLKPFFFSACICVALQLLNSPWNATQESGEYSQMQIRRIFLNLALQRQRDGGLDDVVLNMTRAVFRSVSAHIGKTSEISTNFQVIDQSLFIVPADGFGISAQELISCYRTLALLFLHSGNLEPLNAIHRAAKFLFKKIQPSANRYSESRELYLRIKHILGLSLILKKLYSEADILFSKIGRLLNSNSTTHSKFWNADSLSLLGYLSYLNSRDFPDHKEESLNRAEVLLKSSLESWKHMDTQRWLSYVYLDACNFRKAGLLYFDSLKLSQSNPPTKYYFIPHSFRSESGFTVACLLYPLPSLSVYSASSIQIMCNQFLKEDTRDPLLKRDLLFALCHSLTSDLYFSDNSRFTESEKSVVIALFSALRAFSLGFEDLPLAYLVTISLFKLSSTRLKPIIYDHCLSFLQESEDSFKILFHHPEISQFLSSIMMILPWQMPRVSRFFSSALPNPSIEKAVTQLFSNAMSDPLSSLVLTQLFPYMIEHTSLQQRTNFSYFLRSVYSQTILLPRGHDSWRSVSKLVLPWIISNFADPTTILAAKSHALFLMAGLTQQEALFLQRIPNGIFLDCIECIIDSLRSDTLTRHLEGCLTSCLNTLITLVCSNDLSPVSKHIRRSSTSAQMRNSTDIRKSGKGSRNDRVPSSSRAHLSSVPTEPGTSSPQPHHKKSRSKSNSKASSLKRSKSSRSSRGEVVYPATRTLMNIAFPPQSPSRFSHSHQVASFEFENSYTPSLPASLPIFQSVPLDFLAFSTLAIKSPIPSHRVRSIEILTALSLTFFDRYHLQIVFDSLVHVLGTEEDLDVRLPAVSSLAALLNHFRPSPTQSQTIFTALPLQQDYEHIWWKLIPPVRNIVSGHLWKTILNLSKHPLARFLQDLTDSTLMAEEHSLVTLVNFYTSPEASKLDFPLKDWQTIFNSQRIEHLRIISLFFMVLENCETAFPNHSAILQLFTIFCSEDSIWLHLNSEDSLNFILSLFRMIFDQTSNANFLESALKGEEWNLSDIPPPGPLKMMPDHDIMILLRQLLGKKTIDFRGYLLRFLVDFRLRANSRSEAIQTTCMLFLTLKTIIKLSGDHHIPLNMLWKHLEHLISDENSPLAGTKLIILNLIYDLAKWIDFCESTPSNDNNPCFLQRTQFGSHLFTWSMSVLSEKRYKSFNKKEFASYRKRLKEIQSVHDPSLKCRRLRDRLECCVIYTIAGIVALGVSAGLVIVTQGLAIRWVPDIVRNFAVGATGVIKFFRERRLKNYTVDSLGFHSIELSYRAPRDG